jgi:outer membrane protein assembly factor BamB
MTHRFRFFVLGLIVLLAFAVHVAPSGAKRLPQYRLFPIASPDPQSNFGKGSASNPDPFAAGFGERLRTIGDVDRDRVPDLLISNESYNAPTGQRAVGRLYVFSGRTRQMLRAIDSPFPQNNDRFGFWSAKLTNAAFVTSADGQNVGPFTNQGLVFIFNARTGQLVRVIDDPDPQPNADFGGNIVAPGDLNGDGYPDFVATSSRAFNGSGVVYAFDGKTGQLLYRVRNPDPTQSSGFGFGAAELGDVNGDGVGDYQVGAPFFNEPGANRAGRSYIVSGRDGSIIYTLANPDPSTGARFGQADSDGIALTDITGDRRPDIYVDGFLSNDGTVANAGVGYLFNGRTGALIRRLHDPTPLTGGQFGTSDASAGDIDKNGQRDLIVGATPHHDPTSASNVSKAVIFGNLNLGRILRIFLDPLAQPNADFGNSIASPGDVNRDSFPDFFIGARSADFGGFVNAGVVFAVISRDVTRPSRPGIAGPRRTSRHHVVYRFFSADVDNLLKELRFRCSFDSARLHRCGRRVRANLATGRHVLRVQAVDPARRRSPVRRLVIQILG